MQHVVLQRLESTDEGTFGTIELGELRLFTGELPWRENARSISCIPAGIYPCAFTYSPRFRRLMYLVDGVENRSGIRIHSANFMGDAALGMKCQLNGCIAPGMRIGWMDKQKAIFSSMTATRLLQRKLEEKSFTLEIRNV